MLYSKCEIKTSVVTDFDGDDSIKDPDCTCEESQNDLKGTLSGSQILYVKELTAVNTILYTK